MLSQEVRTAKQVVEDYKKFNQNTVKKVAKRCPVSRAIFYETIKIDENAQLFVEKYKKEAKKKKQEKHLGKQLMNAPKKSSAEKQQRIYMKTGYREDSIERMKQAYEMTADGVNITQIAQKLNVVESTVYKYISEYKKLNGIKDMVYATRLVFNLLNEGLTKEQIAVRLNLHPKTVLYHFNKIKKTHPKLFIKKEKRKCVYHRTTESIQQLLKEGKNVDEICDIMNMKKSTVKNNIYRFEKKNGTYINKVHTNTTDKVKALLEKGMNTNQIANTLNITWASVNYHVEKLHKIK